MSYIVTTHDGARWSVLEENTTDGYVIGFGVLVDAAGEAVLDDAGAPIMHSLFLGRAGLMLNMKCVHCGTVFTAHRDAFPAAEGRAHCEKCSVFRGPYWWLVYKHGLPLNEASRPSKKLWEQAKAEQVAAAPESPTCPACDGRGYIERPIAGNMTQSEVWETAREGCSQCGEPE